MMDNLTLRHAESYDYQPVISVLNEWWGGRSMSAMLPKLFFVHFRNTCFVVEHEGNIVGFLIGFLSQAYPDRAYIHFAGVHPDYRRKGLAGMLYRQFFDSVRKHTCKTVNCVTSPLNKVSIAFHLRMGFSITPGDILMEGISITLDYDGPGADRVLFQKVLGT